MMWTQPRTCTVYSYTGVHAFPDVKVNMYTTVQDYDPVYNNSRLKNNKYYNKASLCMGDKMRVAVPYLYLVVTAVLRFIPGPRCCRVPIRYPTYSAKL